MVYKCLLQWKLIANVFFTFKASLWHRYRYLLHLAAAQLHDWRLLSFCTTLLLDSAFARGSFEHLEREEKLLYLSFYLNGQSGCSFTASLVVRTV